MNNQVSAINEALLASGVVEAGTASTLDAAWQVSRAVQRLAKEVERLRRQIELAYFEAYSLGAGEEEVTMEWERSAARKALGL